MHAYVSASGGMCQFLHFYSNFKLKNGPLNIFYAHSCRFLWSETFVCSYPYIFIHASLCFYARPSFYTCVPRFLCPCKIMNSISVDVFICHCSALWLKTVCEMNIRVKSYQKKETWKPPLSPSLTCEIVLDLLAVLPKPWIFCMADMFLCHYINVTKIICELDPRAKKLLYLCSCPYVSMLEHSLYLCPYVSMLVPLCFYDRNFFYAHVLMFLCP